MRLILCGGGSGEQTIEVNKKFKEMLDNDMPILYIPLAMDEVKHPYTVCYDWVKSELSNVTSNIEMVKSFDELANKNLNDCGALFIGGGNTFKLLKGLKDSGAFNKIQTFINNNGLVFGGSAGAIIFGKDIVSCRSMDNNEVNLEDTRGFDALNGKSLFAHYTNTKSKLNEEENIQRTKLFTNDLLLLSNNGLDILALPEEDSIVINDEQIYFVGNKPYFEFNNGIIIENEIGKNKQL